jgi:hypothetical protein
MVEGKAYAERLEGLGWMSRDKRNLGRFEAENKAEKWCIREGNGGAGGERFWAGFAGNFHRRVASGPWLVAGWVECRA